MVDFFQQGIPALLLYHEVSEECIVRCIPDVLAIAAEKRRTDYTDRRTRDARFEHAFYCLRH